MQHQQAFTGAVAHIQRSAGVKPDLSAIAQSVVTALAGPCVIVRQRPLQPQAVTGLPGAGAEQTDADKGLEQLAAVGIEGPGVLQGIAGYRIVQLRGALLQLSGNACQPLPGPLVLRIGLAPLLQLLMLLRAYVAGLRQGEPGNRLVADARGNRAVVRCLGGHGAHSYWLA
ncbi:hypothetical protein D9M73_184350 [compost metagenome]